MNHLNRLIYKAQKRRTEGNDIAFIYDNDNGTYDLSFNHASIVIESNHKTLDEAHAHCDELAEQYQSNQGMLCISVDYGEGLVLSQNADI